jgi:hypothetical protein
LKKNKFLSSSSSSSEEKEKKKKKAWFSFGVGGKVKTSTTDKSKLAGDSDIQAPVLDVDKKKIQIL